jgi:phage baseplate assembly protein W
MAVQRVDRITETGREKDRFSDFLTDLTPHPNTMDLVKVRNVDAVKRSIRNLILTDRYERLMAPNVGSNIKKLLFEPFSGPVANLIKQYVIETIGNFEPRAKVIKVETTPNDINQSYRVDVYFYVINIPDPVSLTVTLYRVR